MCVSEGANMPCTPQAIEVFKNANMTINKGDMVGIVGCWYALFHPKFGDFSGALEGV